MVQQTKFRFSPRSNRAHLVQWREWGAAAFEEAARSDKLIALLITAFWCGVCQRLDETALSSDEVQLLLNAYFVPVRVEESRRPDVDLRYTHDGWPTLVFFTPAGEPILTVNGMETDALVRVLVELVDLAEKRLLPGGEGSESDPGDDRPPDVKLLSRATVESVKAQLASLEDHANGGFGGPQKYFLSDALLWYLQRSDPECLEHVRLTLDILMERAIYDDIGGGFFRYSSQPDWNEPHREKLLADQASLLRISLLTFERAQHPEYRGLSERLLDYLDQTLGEACAPYFAGCQDYVRTADNTGWQSVIDGLVYCDANAVTASAYLEAARVLDRRDCCERAVRLLDAMWDALRAPAGGMYHYLDADGPHVPGLLLDSVAVGTAMLDAYDTLPDSPMPCEYAYMSSVSVDTPGPPLVIT